MIKKYIIPYSIAIILIGFIVTYYLDSSDIDTITNIKGTNWVIIFSMTLIMYIYSGILYRYILKKRTDVILSNFDTFSLPILMNLWGFIIPFQGSVVYTSLFLKFKYKTKLSEGLSISIAVYVIACIIAGIIGLSYSFYTNTIYSLFSLISVLLLLTPAALYGFHILIRKFRYNHIVSQIKFIRPFLTKFVDLTSDLVSYTKDKKLVFSLFLLNTGHIIVIGIWYQTIATGLHIPLSLFQTILLVAIFKILLIAKFTPGNIGPLELASASVFELSGIDPSVAVLITIITRISTFALMFTIGVYATIHNLKYFHKDNFFSLLSLISKKS